MKSLKRLGATLAMTFVLAVAAFAGETPTPPCVPPGISEAPPCASEPVSDDSGTPGQTETPLANTGSEVSFTDLAVCAIESALLLIF